MSDPNDEFALRWSDTAVARFLKALLWPPSLNASTPGLLGRLGRVLHWCFALSTWFAMLAAITNFPDTDMAGAWAGAAVALALLGRAARYVLSGE